MLLLLALFIGLWAATGWPWLVTTAIKGLGSVWGTFGALHKSTAYYFCVLLSIFICIVPVFSARAFKVSRYVVAIHPNNYVLLLLRYSLSQLKSVSSRNGCFKASSMLLSVEERAVEARSSFLFLTEFLCSVTQLARGGPDPLSKSGFLRVAPLLGKGTNAQKMIIMDLHLDLR